MAELEAELEAGAQQRGGGRRQTSGGRSRPLASATPWAPALAAGGKIRSLRVALVDSGKIVIHDTTDTLEPAQGWGVRLHRCRWDVMLMSSNAPVVLREAFILAEGAARRQRWQKPDRRRF